MVTPPSQLAYVILASPGGRRGRGGMGSFVNHLAAALPRHLPGVHIDVLDTYGRGAFLIMPLTFLFATTRLVARGLSGRAHLLHVHMAAHGSTVRKTTLVRVASALNIPTVLHLHGSVFDKYFRELSPMRRSRVARAMRRATRVIVIGSHWRDFVIGEVGLDPARVVLVHNGVPSAAPPQARLVTGPPRLLMLGELGERKGTPELIAALASAELRGCDWSATLAGTGALDRFRSLARSTGLSTRIAIPGWQTTEQVQHLLQDADILILPSRHEGLPMAILEAMAAGAVVVSTPVGAIPDAIIDGETGLLVPPGDVGALAAAIVRLLHDIPLQQRLRTNARARFDALFTIDKTAAVVASIYRDIGVPR